MSAWIISFKVTSVHAKATKGEGAKMANYVQNIAVTKRNKIPVATFFPNIPQGVVLHTYAFENNKTLFHITMLKCLMSP